MKRVVVHERFARHVPGAARNGLTAVTNADRVFLPGVNLLMCAKLQIETNGAINCRPRKPFCCHVDVTLFRVSLRDVVRPVSFHVSASSSLLHRVSTLLAAEGWEEFQRYQSKCCSWADLQYPA